MRTWALELNDCALLLGDGNSPALHSPGYATITRDEVITGEAARARSRIEPRHTLNQFWLRLGSEALHDTRAHARHHADLAWTQLQRMASQAGEPQRVILAVPGSFSREQLGVLLGIAQRTALHAVGLVDSALAAASTEATGGNTLHLDLQLHQCVLTRIGNDGNTITREAVRTLPGCGLVQLHELWAQLLARRFIQQNRFDPMHAAATEQQLYDQLPRWMNTLHDEREDVAAELRHNGTSYQVKLLVHEVLEAASPVYAQLAEAVQRELQDARLIVSARMAALPGIAKLLPRFTPLDEEAAIHGCLRHEALICGDEAALRFITRLPVSGENSASPAARTAGVATPTARQAPVPSHLVIGGRALRLEPGSLYLYRDQQGWTLSRHMPDAFVGLLRWEGSAWMLVPSPGSTLRLDGIPVRSPSPLYGGQRLQPGTDDDSLRLVTEAPVNGNGP